MIASPEGKLGPSLIVVIPTYNDWEAIALLGDSLDVSLAGLAWRVRVLIVDDVFDTFERAR